MKYIIPLLILSLTLAGCGTPVADEEFVVAATFYPLYDITQKITGDLATVYSVVPTNTEPHGFRPTPGDMQKLSGADVFVSLGVEFEQFEDDLIKSTASKVKLVPAGMGVELLSFEDVEENHDDHADHDEHMEGHDEHEEHAHHEEHDEHSDHADHDEHMEEHDEHEEHAHHEEHDEHNDHADHDEHIEEHDEHEDEHAGHEHHHHSGVDPHIWLSPKNMMEMTTNIKNGLAKADRANKDAYEANAAAVIEELEMLDKEFSEGLVSCAQDTILVNHDAFGYIARDYNLNIISIGGISPETEPTPQQIKKLTEEAQEHNLKYIFYEELVSPRVAETIATEVGAQTLELNPVAGTAQEGEDYFSIMRKNLENLKIALECQ